MKKILLSILCVCLIAGTVGCGNNSSTKKSETKEKKKTVAEETTISADDYKVMSDPEDFEFIINEDDTGYEFDGFANPVREILDIVDKTVIIPDEYHGLPVTGLNKAAFYDDMSKKVVLGKNIKTIDEAAFLECDSLEKIENIDGIQSIGHLSFAYTSISGKLYFPNIKTLEYGALAFMDNITELEFGPNLETVKDDAFSNDKNLKKIIFNSMDTSFEDYKEVEDEDKALNWEVVAPKGSTAEKWAKDNGLKFTAK